MGYTNSPLVAFTKISPNKSSPRSHAIDRITPHCVVGQCSVETLGEIFGNVNRQASSNYGIGPDGRVGMYVEERDRSWCSSNTENDNRAVTIECASDMEEPYAFKDTVYEKLIELCADICRRNGKTVLLWLGDKEKTLVYTPKANEMVLSVHRWFANKSCPGNWLMARMDDLASKVTAMLNGTVIGVDPAPGDDWCNCKLRMPVLKYDDEGIFVKLAQEALIAENYTCGGYGADGIFGAGTEQSVKNFQTMHSLKETGLVGEKEWEKLSESFNKIQNGN